jgi:DNA-binding transcriptional regulator YiaG
MSKKAKKRSPSKGGPRPLSRTSEAQAWRNLAKEFLDASARYAGEAIRLAYRSAPSTYPEGFNLVYVQRSERNEWEEVDIGIDEDYNPVPVSTFSNLAVRALLLARRKDRTSVWQDWAEFLVDTLHHYQEDKEFFGDKRLAHLRSQTFRFVDESVMACQEMERTAMTENPIQRPPRLYAAGLKALRDSRGESQEGFAGEIGYCVRSVMRWEKGQPISEGAVRRICAKLGCSRDDILKEPSSKTG